MRLLQPITLCCSIRLSTLNVQEHIYSSDLSDFVNVLHTSYAELCSLPKPTTLETNSTERIVGKPRQRVIRGSKNNSKNKCLVGWVALQSWPILPFRKNKTFFHAILHCVTIRNSNHPELHEAKLHGTRIPMTPCMLQLDKSGAVGLGLNWGAPPFGNPN